MTQRNRKRKRGGQPGNRNARTHGFYAAQLTEQEVAQYWDAVKKDGLAPSVALLRVKLGTALREAPGNRRVRSDAVRQLARLYGTGLDAEHAAVFREFLRDLLREAKVDETNRA